MTHDKTKPISLPTPFSPIASCFLTIEKVGCLQHEHLCSTAQMHARSLSPQPVEGTTHYKYIAKISVAHKTRQGLRRAPERLISWVFSLTVLGLPRYLAATQKPSPDILSHSCRSPVFPVPRSREGVNTAKINRITAIRSEIQHKAGFRKFLSNVNDDTTKTGIIRSHCYEEFIDYLYDEDRKVTIQDFG
jgi:hypothetical protein